MFYNARYYDPAIGRFISADTIVPGVGALTLAPNDATAREAWGANGGGTSNPQELNRYSYAGNNPVKNTDPTGHCIFALVDTIACVAAAAEVAEVVVTAIAGAALITGAVAVGTEANRAHAVEQAKSDEESASNLPRPHLKGKEQYLPTDGPHSYVPPKRAGSPEIVRAKGGGYIDADGNVWVWDKLGHGGPHWDVQHPGRGNLHTNVYPDGEVHQGKDNFPQQPKAPTNEGRR